jgi:hypothetical protein
VHIIVVRGLLFCCLPQACLPVHFCCHHARNRASSFHLLSEGVLPCAYRATGISEVGVRISFGFFHRGYN